MGHPGSSGMDCHMQGLMLTFPPRPRLKTAWGKTLWQILTAIDISIKNTNRILFASALPHFAAHSSQALHAGKHGLQRYVTQWFHKCSG